ncbi:TlpA family protein disulfide reductase [Dysgonomonas sp. Marseille-P4677]|uniref:peroxiredoxin family protein n=1 Tax=Dysgonomonas sp. Marseille-P4677 TaxID=2364790 RepID=UPI001914B627|nr:TlpA disulfide reductase family protein [Dysgonomonas sp. Marseille-P4677]MBK5719406.1 TlpA family protein disulfide reductase [Dysgonomonas sp. Marseille-P4677]
MKLIYRLLISMFCLSSSVSNAQKINISLLQNSNKEYAFVLNKGIKQDTIQKGIVPFTGDLIINIPNNEKDYVGMGSLQVKDTKPLNVIINHENFSVTQDAGGKYVFENSSENEFLYSIMQGGIMPAPDTSLYAFHFIDMIRYMQQLERVSQGVNLMEKAKARLYALNQLDMEKLYTSSIWYNVIDGMVKLNSSQQMLGEDMITVLKRIKSQEVFEHLADNLITITQQFGLDDAFDIIVPYIQETGRIEVPQGNMYVAFTLAKVRKGVEAPPLEGLSLPLINSDANKTLLIFYAPDCDNCHVQLDQLINLYPDLKKRKIRIVAISSDTQNETFSRDTARFPWPNSDNLCDFKGFGGRNFINYGVMSTPTMFLLDADKKVIKRYALVGDIDFFSVENKRN